MFGDELGFCDFNNRLEIFFFFILCLVCARVLLAEVRLSGIRLVFENRLPCVYLSKAHLSWCKFVLIYLFWPNLFGAYISWIPYNAFVRFLNKLQDWCAPILNILQLSVCKKIIASLKYILTCRRMIWGFWAL